MDQDQTELYRVDCEGKFVMLAPLDTIQAVFNLHKDAIARVRREPVCVLHGTRPNGTITVSYGCELWQALGETKEKS